ncbi:MAG: hypothetical protein QNJ20_11125 [Paracoccaceae bacterium]|nr:hypothetical protein [Paracoccaceae bacterium]
MAENATVSLDQTSRNALHLKLVAEAKAKKTRPEPQRIKPTRPEAADDAEDMWDNVPV